MIEKPMDKTLTERLINGEEPAFKELFRSFYPGLLRFAASYLHDHFLAENTVQDAFLTLWEKHGELHAESNIRAYLVTIVRNKALSLLEKHKSRGLIENSVYEQELKEINLNISSLQALNPDFLFTLEIEAIVKKTIQELPDQTREAFILSRFQGYSNLEIAQKLGITVKGVEYHISKSLRVLRIELADYLSCLLFF